VAKTPAEREKKKEPKAKTKAAAAGTGSRKTSKPDAARPAGDDQDEE